MVGFFYRSMYIFISDEHMALLFHLFFVVNSLSTLSVPPSQRIADIKIKSNACIHFFPLRSMMSPLVFPHAFKLTETTRF